MVEYKEGFSTWGRPCDVITSKVNTAMAIFGNLLLVARKGSSNVTCYQLKMSLTGKRCIIVIIKNPLNNPRFPRFQAEYQGRQNTSCVCKPRINSKVYCLFLFWTFIPPVFKMQTSSSFPDPVSGFSIKFVSYAWTLAWHFFLVSPVKDENTFLVENMTRCTKPELYIFKTKCGGPT